jgi:glycosyltransferase involved in cell wall biosynthesis
MKNKNKFSILINTYQRGPELVIRSLESALKQTLIPNEVILVDQNQEEIILPIHIKKNLLFKHQRCNFSCVSQARNAGVFLDDTDWIIICDDDGYLAPDYLNKLNTIIENDFGNHIALYGGSIHNDDGSGFYSKRQKFGGNPNHLWASKLVMGANMAILKEAFFNLEKFDIRFGAGGTFPSSEETDFCWKVIYSTTYKVAYRKELIVYHPPPHNIYNLTNSKKSFNYCIGKGALVAKWIIEQRKFAVIYELFEMLGIPFLKAIFFLANLKFKIAKIHFYFIFYRIIGFHKFIRAYF